MVVLDSGKEEIISLIANGIEGAEISGINIGEDDTDVDEELDTSLGDELDRIDDISASQTDNTMELVAEFTDNEGTVREAGLYTDDTDDTQISRQVVDEINLQSDDTLEVTFELEANSA